MKKILLTLLTLTSISVFANDYQNRTVYFSATNNLCYRGNSDITDKITIDVTVNKKPFRQYITHGAVSCNYSDLVYGRSFGLFDSDNGTDVSFSDSKIQNNKIINMQSKIKNPVSIEGVNYQCTIDGNDTPDKYNEATILLNCEPLN